MKRIAKEITLKEDTINDINSGNIDTDLFIRRINGYLEKANYLINNKMIDMSKEELYRSLSEVFDIYFEPYDYVKMISMKNGMRYTRFVNINTYMYDEDNNNISYLGVATRKADCQDNETLSLDKLRKLTDSYDLVLLKQRVNKNEAKSGRRDPFESHLFEPVNVNVGIIDETSEFYPYAIELLEKELIIKYALYDIKLYVDEVLHQAREITSLAKVKDDEKLAAIGKQYKKAYQEATSEQENKEKAIPKKKKVSVRYHQKVKRPNTNNRGNKK